MAGNKSNENKIAEKIIIEKNPPWLAAGSEERIFFFPSGS